MFYLFGVFTEMSRSTRICQVLVGSWVASCQLDLLASSSATWLMTGNGRAPENPELQFPGISSFCILMMKLLPYTCFSLVCCGWSSVSQGAWLLNPPLAAQEILEGFRKLTWDSPFLGGFNISFSCSIVKPKLQDHFLISHWIEILGSGTPHSQFC